MHVGASNSPQELQPDTDLDVWYARNATSWQLSWSSVVWYKAWVDHMKSSI